MMDKLEYNYLLFYTDSDTFFRKDNQRIEKSWSIINSILNDFST